MPLNSNKTEEEVLDFIFRKNSNIEHDEQEVLIRAYKAIKHHIPNSLFEFGKIKFNYNKGLSYIVASCGDIQLFKIPNDFKTPIEFICPPEKEYIDLLKVSDLAKDSTLKRYKDTKAKVWYIKMTPQEVLSLSSYHWEGFKKILKAISSN